jgi:hypothetical protein
LAISETSINVRSPLHHPKFSEVTYLPAKRDVAPDYYDVVRHPMDLQTVTKKLNQFEYRSRLHVTPCTAVIGVTLVYNMDSCCPFFIDIHKG